GTDVDDGAVAPGQHVLAEGPAAPEGAVEVHVDHVVPVFVRDGLGRGLAACDAGVVDEDVDLAVTCHELVGDCGHARRVGDVHLHDLGVKALAPQRGKALVGNGE